LLQRPGGAGGADGGRGGEGGAGGEIEGGFEGGIEGGDSQTPRSSYTAFTLQSPSVFLQYAARHTPEPAVAEIVTNRFWSPALSFAQGEHSSVDHVAPLPPGHSDPATTSSSTVSSPRLLVPWS